MAQLRRPPAALGRAQAGSGGLSIPRGRGGGWPGSRADVCRAGCAGARRGRPPDRARVRGRTRRPVVRHGVGVHRGFLRLPVCGRNPRPRSAGGARPYLAPADRSPRRRGRSDHPRTGGCLGPGAGPWLAAGAGRSRPACHDPVQLRPHPRPPRYRAGARQPAGRPAIHPRELRPRPPRRPPRRRWRRLDAAVPRHGPGRTRAAARVRRVDVGVDAGAGGVAKSGAVARGDRGIRRVLVGRAVSGLRAGRAARDRRAAGRDRPARVGGGVLRRRAHPLGCPGGVRGPGRGVWVLGRRAGARLRPGRGRPAGVRRRSRPDRAPGGGRRSRARQQRTAPGGRDRGHRGTGGRPPPRRRGGRGDLDRLGCGGPRVPRAAGADRGDLRRDARRSPRPHLLAHGGSGHAEPRRAGGHWTAQGRDHRPRPQPLPGGRRGHRGGLPPRRPGRRRNGPPARERRAGAADCDGAGAWGRRPRRGAEAGAQGGDGRARRSARWRVRGANRGSRTAADSPAARERRRAHRRGGYGLPTPRRRGRSRGAVGPAGARRRRSGGGAAGPLGHRRLPRPPLGRAGQDGEPPRWVPVRPRHVRSAVLRDVHGRGAHVGSTAAPAARDLLAGPGAGWPHASSAPWQPHRGVCRHLRHRVRLPGDAGRGRHRRVPPAGHGPQRGGRPAVVLAGPAGPQLPGGHRLLVVPGRGTPGLPGAARRRVRRGSGGGRERAADAGGIHLLHQARRAVPGQRVPAVRRRSQRVRAR